LQIVQPQIVLVLTQVEKVGPRIDTGVVTIGKAQLKAVVPYRLKSFHRDIPLASLEHLLARAVSSHLRRRAEYAQQLEG
jgi:hypothetical protein